MRYELEEDKHRELATIDENKVITFADQNLEWIIREEIKTHGAIEFGEVRELQLMPYCLGRTSFP